jgi:ketosteroid isomerase-like protein
MWSVESDHRRLVRSAPACEGRAAMQRALADAFARRAGRRRTMICRVDSVRFVRPDVAIVDGTIEVREPAGAAEPGRGIAEPFTSVMTKTERDWSIAASRVGATEAV